MNDRIRYKCLKCGREIFFINNGQIPFCCGQNMVTLKNLETLEKIKNINSDQKDNLTIEKLNKNDEEYSLNFLKSKF